MKKHFIPAILLVLSCMCFSQVVIDTPYVVGTWRGFTAGAVSYTFDDGCANQFTVAVPMFNAKNFYLTLFTVVTGGLFPGWAKVDTAAAHGHEVASHTMTHTSLQGMAAVTQNSELKNSKDSINKYIPGRQCITMAYPYCNRGTDSICAKYYIAGRTCSGQIVPKNPTNFMDISSFLCGPEYGGATTTAALNTLANNAANSNGWCVYLFHGVENDGGYSPISTAALQGNVDYMSANSGRYWVETFGNVTRYIKERNASSVRGVSRTADSITLRVTDTLNDTVFNYPISIRRPLPAGWTTPAVLQGGIPLTAQFKDSNSIRYVTFDAVPDRGNVLILRNGTGVKMQEPDLSGTGNLKVWFNRDGLAFSLPASAGLILDISLYDLKGAQIADMKVNRKGRDVGSIRLPGTIAKCALYVVRISDGRLSWSKQCFPQ